MNEAKRKNILFAVIAVAVAIVFFFAGFGTGFGVGKGAADAPNAEAGAGFEINGGMQLSSDDDTDRGVSLMPVKLARNAYDEYGIMPIAEEAYTVTATVSGDGLTAEQKNVTWGEAAFKNPSSEWAIGKNVSEYVKATPSGNQITVQCLRAFGEQIIIKCSSSFNPNVSKDLKVDYKEKIEFDGVNIDGKDITRDLVEVHISSSHNASVSAIFSRSEACTIESDVVTAKLDFKLTNDARMVLGSFDLMEYTISVTSDSPTGTYNNFLDIQWRNTMFHMSSFDRHYFNKILQNFEDSPNPLGGGWYVYTMIVTLSNSDTPIDLGDGLVIEIDGDSVLEWGKNYLSQLSVSGIEFDEPYSDGVIFNQD